MRSYVEFEIVNRTDRTRRGSPLSELRNESYKWTCLYIRASILNIWLGPCCYESSGRGFAGLAHCGTFLGTFLCCMDKLAFQCRRISRGSFFHLSDWIADDNVDLKWVCFVIPFSFDSFLLHTWIRFFSRVDSHMSFQRESVMTFIRT